MNIYPHPVHSTLSDTQLGQEELKKLLAIAKQNGGEFAEVVEKVSPLNNGLSCSDYMWWAHPEKRVNTYNQSIYYKSLIPKNVTPIVKHIPLHTYGLKWRVQYLVLEVNTGKGKIILSTLNFDGVDLDPAAARFAVNLVDSLFNLAGSINNKY